MSATLCFELPKSLALNANSRLHWAPKADVTRNLRALGRIAAKETGQKFDGPVSLLIEVGWPDRRRRDAENFAPTVKALTDGAVDAGLLADDSDAHIVERIWRGSVSGKPGITTVMLTFTEVEG